MKTFFKNEVVQKLLFCSLLLGSIIGLANLIVYGMKLHDPIPTAGESRQITNAFIEAHPSYKEMKLAVVKEITHASKLGQHKIDMYVGQYPTDVRGDVYIDLLVHGYRAELYSPLSGKDDFLKVEW